MMLSAYHTLAGAFVNGPYTCAACMNRLMSGALIRAVLAADFWAKLLGSLALCPKPCG